MKSLILDTNAFLRFLLKDIPTQTKQVKNLITQAKNNKLTIIVPTVVIFEIIFALDKFYKFPKDKIISMIGDLLTTPYFDIEELSILKETLILFNNQKLSFTDCFLFCLAQNTSAEVFTFDRNLKKLRSALA